VIDVSFWDAGREHVEEREQERPSVTQESYTRDMQNIFRNKFNLNVDLPVVFLDAYYTRSNSEEVDFFDQEIRKLWREAIKRRSFRCKTRTEVQATLDSQQDTIARLREKMRAKRAPLLQRIAELEEYETVCNAGVRAYQTVAECQNVEIGCSWTDWGRWHGCLDGVELRTRGRVFGTNVSLTCEGEDTENRTGCVDVHGTQWWEREDTMAVMIGGETSNGMANNVAVLKGTDVCTNVPQFPIESTRMAVAYSRSMTMHWSRKDFILACGGLYLSGSMPERNCYRLAQGDLHWIRDTNLKEAVAGGAMAWFRNEMWLVGGAKGDDSQAGTEISDKIQIYSPRSRSWRYHRHNFPRQVNRACAVNIETSLVVTGGTTKKVQQLEKLRGTQNTAVYDAQTPDGWVRIENMREKRAGHACELAYINGMKGVVVAGGSNAGDSVEFLDWATKEWVMVKQMFKQRRFGLGLAYVGGNLTAVGGYYWPNPVAEVEQYDKAREDWAITDVQTDEGRFNFGLVTVPKNMLLWTGVPLGSPGCGPMG